MVNKLLKLNRKGMKNAKKNNHKTFASFAPSR